MINFAIVLCIFVVTILFGVPIAFSMGITSFIYIIITDPANLVIVPNKIFGGINQFNLMAIPFFILAAELMVSANISKRLFTFGRLFFGRFRGGLAIVNVFGSTIFGGISGTALGDIAGLGAIEMDAMNDDGYDPDYSCALTAASSLQSPLIPPSNIAILYAGIMGLSTGGLLIAGAIPGIMLGFSQIILVLLVRNRRNFPKDTKKYTKDEIFSIAGNGLITLTMPAILLIGILSGIFTPTESGCIAGVYALFLALMIYRNISLDTLIAILKNTAKTCANIFMIIAFATIFAWIMAAEQIPNIIAEFMLGITSNKYLLLFLINIFLLIVGMWMDTGAAIILFAPILGPIMTRIGVHPIHFGVIMLVNLTLGLITPPVGVVLYSACTVGHRKIEGVIRELFPFIIVGILVLVLVTYFPETVLLLPRLAGFL